MEAIVKYDQKPDVEKTIRIIETADDITRRIFLSYMEGYEAGRQAEKSNGNG